MTDVPGQRVNIQVEETDFRSAVSEAVASKLGASLNFVNNFQYDTKAWFLNGNYDAVAKPQTGVDGLYIVPYDIEIMGASIYNLVDGLSRSIILDVHRISSPGVDAGSIFTTRPEIPAGEGNDSYVGAIFNVNTGTIQSLGGGGSMVEPVFSSLPLDVDQGEALRLDFDEDIQQGESAGLVLYMRPR
jgi:hypothetical protein